MNMKKLVSGRMFKLYCAKHLVVRCPIAKFAFCTSVEKFKFQMINNLLTIIISIIKNCLVVEMCVCGGGGGVGVFEKIARGHGWDD